MGARGNSSDEDPSSVSEFEDESMSEAGAGHKPPAKKGKTIEQRYTKMTQLEHILARPDTYVGSTSLETTSAWVWAPEKNGIVMRQISYVPALYKIFDEIIVNAADVKARELFEDGRAGGKKMTRLDIVIDEEEGSVSVGNDGSCIPIEIHKEHNVYVPELIFGHLLTSDNYDDSEKRVTGGRNGYGAKLTNVFSKKFSVDCSDIRHKRYFHMTWSNNMSRHTEPSITSRAGADSGLIFSQGRCPSDYVRVKFWPDFARLNMPEGKFSPDVISLFQKRAYDMAGSVAGIAVYLNGERLSYVKSFKDYVDLYFPGRAKAPAGGDSSPKRKKKKSGASSASASENEADEPVPVKEEDGGTGADLLPPPLKIYEKINDMWEVVISESETGAFQQVSFVNSICTSKGGTHIALLIDPIVQAVLKKVNTKNRGGFEVKGSHVKNHIFIFVNCRVVNPTFDSQTKEWMSLSMKALSSGGVTPSVSDKTITAIVKSGITENVILWAQMKESVELKKMMKGKSGAGGRDRILGIPKLEDANDAGTSKWKDCTLILTEGDSAKTSCIAGLSVVGKDKYGVFPLRGKLLNVRDASFQSLSENKEIQNLLKITGLEIKHKSAAGAAAADPGVFPRLRYGSIMIMTDQDYDGSHIKGLLINLLQYYWPEILKLNSGFLKQFITPIIKATKKSTSGKPKVLSFFTIKQYQEWKKAMENTSANAAEGGGGGAAGGGASSALSGWTIKYYKGLGTSTDKEFIEYFKDLGKHSLEFTYEDEADFETIDMAFNAKRSEDRKRWISSFNEESGMEYGQPAGRESTGAPIRAAPLVRVRYSDFINKELVQFSRYDLERSIPCLVDGLKPAQRKAVFGALKKGLFTKEMKVAQLAAYISDVSCYHHGEDSMAAALVNMAQTFVGSTNINVFEPRGQFGSRKEGGKDASATRYIYTKLTKISKAIFKADDDPILQYRNEEGKAIEPKFYVPVIPMILVNGSEGIGTGWSSSVPNFNPAEIIQNIRVYLLHREQVDADNPNVMIDAGSNEDGLRSMLQPMRPWYRGFIGRIEENAKGSYDSIGIVEIIDDEGTLFISELPVKQWTQPYKEFLEELLQVGLGRDTAPAAATSKATAKAKAKARTKAAAAPRRAGAAGFQSHHKLAIDDYRDNSTHESIAFTVKMTDEQRHIAEAMGGLEKALKLRKPITTSNMTLFDDQGQVRKYADELEILLAFCRVRLYYYQKRKRFRVISLEKELCYISNKLKFVLAVVDGTLRVNNRKKQELEAELLSLGFEPRELIDARHNTANETLVTEVDVDGTLEAPDVDEDLVKEQENRTKTQESGPGGQFDYLLGMQIYNLTYEKVEQLKRQHQAKEQELNIYRAKTVNQLWLEDLDELEAALIEADLTGSAEKAEAEKARRVAQGLAAHSRPLKVAPKRRAVKKAVKKEEIFEADDDDSLFSKLKAATNAACVAPGKAKSDMPQHHSTTTTSSSDFGLMEALRMRLNADSTIASSGLPAPGPTNSYSNPPVPTGERKKRVSPPTSNPIATTHAAKRSKKVAQSDEEDELDEVMTLSEEDEEDDDGVVVDDDDDDEDDDEDDDDDDEDDEEDDEGGSDSD